VPLKLGSGKRGASIVAPIAEIVAVAAEGDIATHRELRGDGVLERSVGNLPDQDAVPVLT
jgi:hypothetical protein